VNWQEAIVGGKQNKAEKKEKKKSK